jgi:hypothetical protein
MVRCDYLDLNTKIFGLCLKVYYVCFSKSFLIVNTSKYIFLFFKNYFWYQLLKNDMKTQKKY